MMVISLDGFPVVTSPDGVNASAIVYKTLRSAQFWELTNMRLALLSAVNDETSPLDKINAATYTFGRPTEEPSIDETQCRRAISAYELLLFIPTEYLPRASRQDLIRRAMKADFAMHQLSHGDNSSQAHIIHSTTVLRVFLKRWFSYQNSADHKVYSYFSDTVISYSWPTDNSGLRTPSHGLITDSLTAYRRTYNCDSGFDRSALLVS